MRESIPVHRNVFHVPVQDNLPLFCYHTIYLVAGYLADYHYSFELNSTAPDPKLCHLSPDSETTKINLSDLVLNQLCNGIAFIQVPRHIHLQQGVG